MAQQPGIVPEPVCSSGAKIISGRWRRLVHADRAVRSISTAAQRTAISRMIPGHVCQVNGDCKRFLELWNLVFIQYNRTGPDLAGTAACQARGYRHGLRADRLGAAGVDSNYRTDLFSPLIQAVQALTGRQRPAARANFTPYRVIADHARAAAFLIADGVVPGNTGRNYVCRMIIRRAARFGSKIGLHEPFLAKVASSRDRELR